MKDMNALLAGFGGQGILFMGKVIAYAERVSVDCVKNINRAKKAIKKAFKNQIEGKGFSLVEVISTCPTNWGMTPQKALDWAEENMIPYYPLGVYKDIYAKEEEK